MKRLLKIVFVLVPYILHAYFKWILRYALNKDKYPLSLRFYKTQELIRHVLKGLYLNISEKGIEEVYKNDEKFFGTCNHQSDADPLLLIAVAKRPISFIAKKEVKKMPFIGKVFYLLDGKFIDRKDLKSQIKILNEVEEDLKNQVKDWVIFPEGTRNKNPTKDILVPFHHGTFKIPLKSGVRMVNFAAYGTFRSLHFLNYLKPNLPIQIEAIGDYKFNEFKNETSQTLTEKVYSITYKKVEELKANDSVLIENIND